MNTFRCTKLNKIIIIIWHNVWPQKISLYKNYVQSWRKYQLQFLYLSISMGKQLFIQFKGRSNTSPDLWWFLIWQQRIVRWQLSSKLLYIKKIKQEQKVSSLLSCTGYQSLSRCFMMGWVLNLMETWPNMNKKHPDYLAKKHLFHNCPLLTCSNDAIEEQKKAHQRHSAAPWLVDWFKDLLEATPTSL